MPRSPTTSGANTTVRGGGESRVISYADSVALRARRSHAQAMAQSATSTGQPERATGAAARPQGSRRPRVWPGRRVIAAAAVLHAALVAWLVVDWRYPTPLPAPEALQVRLVPAPPPAPRTPPRVLVAAPTLPEPVPVAEARVQPAAAEVPAPAARKDQWASSQRAVTPPVAADGAEHVPAGATTPFAQGAELKPLPLPAALSLKAEPKQQLATFLRPTPKPPVPHRAESQPVRSIRPANRSLDPAGSRDPVVDALAAGDALYSVAVETSGRIGAVTLVRSSGSPAFDQAGENMIRTTMNFPRPAEGGAATTFFSVTLHFTPEQQ